MPGGPPGRHTPEVVPVQKRTQGIVYMLCSSLCFSLMNVFVRLSGELPAMQKSFFRNCISLAVAAVLILRTRPSLAVPRSQRKHLFFRCFFGTIGVVCNFYSVDHMLLSDATMLNKMSPFFSTLFAAWLLKERATWVHILLSGVALSGCALILRPSLTGLIAPAAAVALLGGLTAGLAYAEVRVLGVNQVEKDLIILCFSAFSCLSALPFLIFDYAPMTFSQLGFLLLAGVAATGGQFGITAAYCCAPAAEVSVYDYSQILFAALLGYMLFQQIPDGLSVLGYFVICGAAVAMTIYNNSSALHPGRAQDR